MSDSTLHYPHLGTEETLEQVSTNTGARGQQAMAASFPVVIASDQAAIPVSGSFSEEATAADGGSLPAKVKVIGGYDGANVQAILTSTAGEVKVVVSSAVGFSASEFVRRDYSSASVSTAAYSELIASTASTYDEVEIFDSSGQTLKLAIGGAGAEVDKFLITPGGNGRIKYRIPSGSRVSIKAVSGTANAGEISMNLYGN